MRALVEEDRRYSVKFIANKLNLSVGSTHSILKDHLNLSKLSGRWVPKLLREDQLAMRTDLSLQTLSKWDANLHNFEKRIVTGDETWLYQYDYEDKKQSKQWRPRENLKDPLRRLCQQFFGESEHILLIDYLEGQRTIN